MLHKKEILSALLSYFVILLFIVLYRFSQLGYFRYLPPLFFILTPLVFRVKIHFCLSIRALAEAIFMTAVLLIPFYLFSNFINEGQDIPVVFLLLFHLIVVAIPEEVYFRGYLQEILGSNYRGVVIVSLLFTLMHLIAFFNKDNYSTLLTFFPSLFMGWLYLKKRNLLFPITFHYFSNLLFISFF